MACTSSSSPYCGKTCTYSTQGLLTCASGDNIERFNNRPPSQAPEYNSVHHASTGMCVHPLGGTAADNVEAVFFPGCDSDTHVQLKHGLTPKGSIQHRETRMCLNPESGDDQNNIANNTKLVYRPECDTDRTAFSITPDGGLKHVKSGKCVHPQGGVGYPNAQLVLHDGCDIEDGRTQISFGTTFRYHTTAFGQIALAANDPRAIHAIETIFKPALANPALQVVLQNFKTAKGSRDVTRQADEQTIIPELNKKFNAIIIANVFQNDKTWVVQYEPQVRFPEHCTVRATLSRLGDVDDVPYWQASTNYPLNDLPKMPRKGVTREKCATMCKANDNCAGFSYNTQSSECWLKTKLANKGSDVNTVSWKNPWHAANYPGNDLPGMPRKVNNRSECADACMKEPACAGVSYNVAAKDCWMKSSMQNRANDLSRQTLSWTNPWKVKRNYPMNDLPKMPVKSVATQRECAVLCAQTPGCVGLSYNQPAQDCWLKSKMENEGPDDFTVSWIRPPS